MAFNKISSSNAGGHVRSIHQQQKQQQEENIYHNSIACAKPNRNLTIKVPPIVIRSDEVGASMASPSSLGEPIHLSSSQSNVSPSKINFDKISQLPTPVINNSLGTFPIFSQSPPQDNNALEIHKSRSGGNRVEGGEKSSPRVVSDYKPLPPIGRKNSLLDSANSPSKRIVSNPVSLASSANTLVSREALILSSSTDNLSKYSNQIFQSPKANKIYKYNEEIGSGNFSTVILAANISNENDIVAIKIISIPIDSKSEIYNFKYFIRRELNILYQVNHPCIIHLLDYNISLPITRHEIEVSHAIESESEKEEEIGISKIDYNSLKLNTDQLIFLNYCPGGNLFQFVYNYFKFHNCDLTYWLIMERIICELIISISYLHSKNIIHRDIKLENVLLNYTFEELVKIVHSTESFDKPIICLTDFGLAKRLKSPDELLSTRCGSQDYIPPEILMGLKYDGKLTDSWSVGVLIYAVLEDRLPFDIPPLSMLAAAGVSPSVIKRKRSRTTAAHRIAMIDWDWFSVNDLVNDIIIDSSVKVILYNLRNIVDFLLVRKDKRLSITELLDKKDFTWIRDRIPDCFYNF